MSPVKTFLTGLTAGLLAGLVSCGVPPAATGVPTQVLETATLPPSATAPPTQTATTAPRSSATSAPSVTAAATATLAATDTPASSPTATATATPAATTTPVTVFITYQDFEIVPAAATIRLGTRVVFQIRAGLLTFHQPYNFAAPNTFEAPANLGDGATYVHTFTEPGTVTLLCGYHADMRATLIVQP